MYFQLQSKKEIPLKGFTPYTIFKPLALGKTGKKTIIETKKKAVEELKMRVLSGEQSNVQQILTDIINIGVISIQYSVQCNWK